MIQSIQETPSSRTGGSIEGIADPRVRVHAPFSLLIHVEATLGRQPGEGLPQRPLALTGGLHLPELRGEIPIRRQEVLGHGNQLAGDRLAMATIIPRNLAMPIPLECLTSSAREGWDVWVLTPLADRDRPWIEHYAGQLQDEPIAFDLHVPVEATLDVTLTPTKCENGGGASVDVTGELRFERSTSVRLLFRDPERSMGPSSESKGEEVVLIPEGSRIAIRETMSSPAGREAWMTVRVIEPLRRVVCVEQSLSRQG
jgi:hypothetical protein